MTALFQRGNFTLHSGATSHWKIECDALTNEDWNTIALMIVEQAEPLLFSRVVGVPRGGLKLANALYLYRWTSGPTLVVDDVLTTGNSILEVMQKQPGPCIAWVVFARGVCPPGINALFRMPGA